MIPAYNAERFLACAIDSALEQTYRDTEVIVVDDGSAERTAEVAVSYGDRILLLRQTNMGLAHAANAGIKRMSGRWLKWLSPDDILVPNAVEALVSRSGHLPENSIVYSNWDIMDESGARVRPFRESNFNGLTGFEFNVRLLDGQRVNINTALFPHSLFRAGCMFRQLDYTAAIDYDFLLRAGMLFGARFYLVEEGLLRYRVHEKQESHRDIVGSLRYIEGLRSEILDMLDGDLKARYRTALERLSSEKAPTTKAMEAGLSAIRRFGSSGVSDMILRFYLDRIRSSR